MQTVLGITFLLGVAGEVALSVTFVGLVANAAYYTLLESFPNFHATSLPFLASGGTAKVSAVVNRSAADTLRFSAASMQSCCWCTTSSCFATFPASGTRLTRSPRPFLLLPLLLPGMPRVLIPCPPL